MSSDATTMTRNVTKKVMMIIDVTRAYFEVLMKKEICIELQKKDWIQEDGSQDLFGQLQKSLYGIRDVASNFEAEINQNKKVFFLLRINTITSSG